MASLCIKTEDRLHSSEAGPDCVGNAFMETQIIYCFVASIRMLRSFSASECFWPVSGHPLLLCSQ